MLLLVRYDSRENATRVYMGIARNSIKASNESIKFFIRSCSVVDQSLPLMLFVDRRRRDEKRKSDGGDVRIFRVETS